jgi:predicted DNA-binding transcriptional regulator AlpA
MATTNLNISVIDKRMLKLSEAASYVGLALKHFKSACPVRPVELKGGTLLWDRRDIDTWIDDVKSGEVTETRDTILDRLG